MTTAWRVLAMVLTAGACQAMPGGGEATVRGSTETSAGVRLSARDNGRRVEIRVGQRLTVELRANPSTGYSWALVSSGEPVILRVGEPAFREDSRMAGAGGTLTFEFRARQPGTGSLELVYARPWEKGKEPADTFAVTVAVAE